MGHIGQTHGFAKKSVGRRIVKMPSSDDCLSVPNILGMSFKKAI